MRKLAQLTLLVALALPAGAHAAPGLSVDSLTATGTEPGSGGVTLHRQQFTVSWTPGAGEQGCTLTVTSPGWQTVNIGVEGSTSTSGSILAEPGATLTFTLRWGTSCSGFPPDTVSTTATAVAYDPGGGGGGGGDEPPPGEPEPIEPDPAQPPAAAMSVTFAGLLASFVDESTDPDGDIATTSWSFGDGGNATGSPATHLYDAAGSYVVIQTVVDATGLASEASYVVNVSALGGTSTMTQRLSQPLTRVYAKSRLAPVDVYCYQGAHSLTIVGSRSAGLSAGHCRELEQLLRTRAGKKRNELAAKRAKPIAAALFALGHETAHARGTLDERQADCAGRRKLYRLARAAGVKPVLAIRLAKLKRPAC